jgi:4'-phosphopantetheinyl transferase
VVKIWWAAPSSVDQAADMELLSTAEMVRLNRLRSPADRGRFSTAWALVRRTLAEINDVEPRALNFTRSCELCGHPAHGRPRLVAGGPAFSLSHSGDRVLLAVSDTGVIGADVEMSGRDVTRLARRILHTRDPRCEGPELVRMWVRKEAIVKATGHGLARPMKTIELADPPHGAQVLDIPADDGYFAAVAIIDRPPLTR